MADYIVADIEITDPEEYQQYAQQVGATITKYDGNFWFVGASLRP